MSYIILHWFHNSWMITQGIKRQDIYYFDDQGGKKQRTVLNSHKINPKTYFINSIIWYVLHHQIKLILSVREGEKILAWLRTLEKFEYEV
jgi:hypothetical protein